MTMSVSVTNWDHEIVYENRNGVERFFAPDTLGSTAMLMDPTGTVTDTFTYWPYGEIVNHTGSSTTTFTYVGTLGYYFDAVVNWFYVRARIYRQALARWLTLDLLWPALRPFSYVGARPTIMVDPTGLMGIRCTPSWKKRISDICFECRESGDPDYCAQCKVMTRQYICQCDGCNNNPMSDPCVRIIANWDERYDSSHKVTYQWRFFLTLSG